MFSGASSPVCRKNVADRLRVRLPREALSERELIGARAAEIAQSKVDAPLGETIPQYGRAQFRATLLDCTPSLRHV